MLNLHKNAFPIAYPWNLITTFVISERSRSNCRTVWGVDARGAREI